MYEDVALDRRQLWGLPSRTVESSVSVHCTPFTLPSRGVVAFDGTTLTLTGNAVFKPECTGKALSDISTIAEGNAPFYASTIPQTYVIAAATVIAWILVIMLLITPRTNFLGQSGTTPGFSSGHGIIGDSTGGNTDLIGIGSRPWLQKVAAFTVAISLTIATADTFKFAERQYAVGLMNGTKLRNDVLGSLEIRTMRVITDVFLWLAQVQTLIRLFPRHKEKVLIKWIGFALILFDSVFTCLNSFLVDYKNQHTPQQFSDAVPALSYLFEFAVGLLYAAWVMYYSVTKRRYAFYHQKMPSIGIIALLSLIAVLTPVVFFVTDVSSSDIAGWGDYFRWVGAAAASVVVWEWVERIEALERDEKKDGILGREIFDGDEMLDITPSDEIVWAQSRYDRTHYRRNGSDDAGTQSSALESGLSRMAQRFRARAKQSQQRLPYNRTDTQQSTTTAQPTRATKRSGGIKFGELPRPGDQSEDAGPSDQTPPSRVVSPVSRADTTSAASTVYVVQYNPAAEVPQPVRRAVDPNGNTERERAQARAQRNPIAVPQSGDIRDPEKEEVPAAETDVQPNRHRANGAWLPVTNPFKRKRASPPVEIQQARQELARNAARAATPAHNFSRWDIKNRVGVLAAETGEKWRDRKLGRRQSEDVAVTVVPAQPRGSGKAWVPSESTHPRVVQPTGTTGSPERHLGLEDVATSSSLTASIPASSAERSDPQVVAGSSSTPIHRITSAAPEPERRSPPRADDLRPQAGSTSPVIVPAPKNWQKTPPLVERQSSASAPGSGATGSAGEANG